MTLPFSVPGYEDMELSTQVLIQAAKRYGIGVSVLDRGAQFLKLSKNNHVEYVKEATKTSKDSYISSLIMENKSVSKMLLKEAGISVPEGREYENMEEAKQDLKYWSQKPCVVKPKNTNFGIGISIFQNSSTENELSRALELAERHGSFLIESFIPGIECRFLVIAGKCVAVLHRVPANVMGDGIHSIQELVSIKNSDPRRGLGHKTPLEKIQIDEVELVVLKKQGLNPHSIPEKDVLVHLRENSNISSGGDSIDYTEKVHPTYFTIAEQAAEAIPAKICGVDMILSEHQKTASRGNHAIIEVNFNPVLYFHDFPFEGKNRKAGEAMIRLLFPELF